MKHHKALHFSEMAEALAKVDATRCSKGIKLGVRFMVLTAARPCEVRKAEWSQIDRKARVWHCPEVNMKAGRAHDVPLSDGAMKMLAAAERELRHKKWTHIRRCQRRSIRQIRLAEGDTEIGKSRRDGSRPQVDLQGILPRSRIR